MSKAINIRPTTSVYATYKNINYQIWNAIAEFVDNSTQSFFDNEKKLTDSKYWKGLNIDISYKKDVENNYYLEIRDNAFGMDFEDFKRAIILDSKPKRVGRSEFGMGLKTAACWFGNKWSVESTMLGSTNRYYTLIDVEILSKYRNETVEVEISDAKKDEHGTTIRIWDLHRTIKGRQVSKTKGTLSGIYRKDLSEGKIRMYYNDELLRYEYPEVYSELIDDKNVEWKKNIEFSIQFEENEYNVSGSIGIRKIGSVKEAGFSLFRHGRAIVGGYEDNYRPHEIFGDSNSYPYQRLFGDLTLDGWPVVQTKDNFYWNNGLEDLFIDKLVEETEEYVKKSKIIRSRAKQNISELTNKALDELGKSGLIEIISVETLNQNLLLDQVNYEMNSEESQIPNESFHDASIEHDNNDRIFRFKYLNIDYIFNLIFLENDPTANWLNIKDGGSENEYSIYWNMRHSFFKTLESSPDYIEIMSKFIFSLALAEISSKKISADGKIEAGVIRTLMNDSLKLMLTGGRDNE